MYRIRLTLHRRDHTKSDRVSDKPVTNSEVVACLKIYCLVFFNYLKCRNLSNPKTIY